MKTILLQLLLIISHIAFSQEVNENVENSIKGLSDTGDEKRWNSDSVLTDIGKQLVATLKKTGTNPYAKSNYIQKVSSKDKVIEIYTFSYETYGTRGTVHNPVIRWRNSNGTFGAYALFPVEGRKTAIKGIEMEFTEVHRLPSPNRTLYLLIGSERGDTHVYEGMAMVVEIKGNQLLLNYPAFFGLSPILIYNDDLTESAGACLACIHYSPASKTLSIDQLDQQDSIWVYDGKETKKNVGRLSSKKRVNFTFNGSRFIQVQ
jgi:hypothetical protein